MIKQNKALKNQVEEMMKEKTQTSVEENAQDQKVDTAKLMKQIQYMVQLLEIQQAEKKTA